MPIKTLSLPVQLGVVILLFGLSVIAQAKPLIVTTTTTLADLVKNTVGPDFDVFAITKGPQDPHYVEAKPSFMVKVRRAKAVVSVGLELETGWLPLVLRGARNPALMPGNPGYIDASQFVTPIEVITGKVDRSQGDIHGLGNPHYLLNPQKTKKVVKGLSEKFQQLFPDKATAIQNSSKQFLSQLDARIPEWKSRLSGKGPFVTYHRTLNDFFHGFGLSFAGAIESKPGIPPAARHIMSLIETIREKKVTCLLVESFFETSAAVRLQKSTQTGISVVPVEVKAVPTAGTYLEMMETIIKGVENCRPGEVHRG